MAGITPTVKPVVYTGILPGPERDDPSAAIRSNLQTLINQGRIKLTKAQENRLSDLKTPQEIAAWVSGNFGLKVNSQDWSITGFPEPTSTQQNPTIPPPRGMEDVVYNEPVTTPSEGPGHTTGAGTPTPPTSGAGTPTPPTSVPTENEPVEWGGPSGVTTNEWQDIFSQRPKYEIPDEVSQMLEEYQTGAGKIEDLYGKSRTQILAEARRAQKDVLGETRRTGEQALDVFRTRAYGGLPGERQMYEQIGASTAGAIRDITQRGGGGGQGAIADVYGMQQQGVRDIGMQRAQYQAGGIEGLAQMTRQTGLDMSNAYRTMAQDYINANLASTQGLGGAYQTGTAMRTAGLGQMANYKDIQWQLNEQQPALAREGFLIDEYRRHDPFMAEMAMYGGEAGMNYAMGMQGMQGQSDALQQLMNTMNQGMSGYMQMDMLNKWFGDKT